MATKTAPKSSPHTYDAIVVGGGHNGLTHAAYLAKGGLRTLVLEQRHLVGGAAITEELYPGFSFTTFSYALSLLRPEIVHELDLVKHGFMPLFMRSSFAPMDNGDYFITGSDREENLNEIRRHSKRDADAMERFDFDLSRVQQFVRPLFDQMAPNIFSGDPEDREQVAWLLKHLGSAPPKVVHDTVRMLFGSIADFVDDYFETEIVKAHLASSAIVGAKLGPMSPGSALVFLYLSMGEHDGALGAWSFHKGGNGGFTQVLARAAQSFGAEIRLDSPVARVLTSGGRATGVVLADGTEFTAPVVVSALDPRRTFTELVDPLELPTDLVETIRRYRFTGMASKVNFALDGPPVYPGLEGRTDHFQGFINIAPTIEYVERAWDTAKYGWYSERPYLDCSVQSFIDPDMAPPGKHVMSCFTQYTPYDLRHPDGTPASWDDERDNLGDTVQRTLEGFFPGFGDLVLHREVVTPLDIERTTGLSEGNIYAGEFLAPQMYFFRPAPGYSDYRTPIEGYYQCGSGTHPGGCVIGSPGRFASQQVLKDLAARGSRKG
ncbi:MAG: NAD(P)/FAD-dependent oxidoreductase [Nocardioides sp.]